MDPLVTEYNFFHDSPTYAGMSGGPIFNLSPAAPGVAGAVNTINVYGVVRGANFGDLQAVPIPSRCNGSFLQISLL